MPGSHEEKRSHVRFYIVMTTLVVVGIVFLLLANDDSSFLTSLAVNQEGEKVLPSFELKPPVASDNTSLLLEGRELDISLELNSVPPLHTQTNVEKVMVKFSDLSPRIMVNNDRLELSNAEQVALTMKDFDGSLAMDGKIVSLAGKVGVFSVNGLTLSSKGSINIFFEDVPYDAVSFEGIELRNLEFPRGDGTLHLAEKLQYELEQDRVSLRYFNGKMEVTRGEQSSLQMEGVATSVSISGALANFDLR